MPSSKKNRLFFVTDIHGSDRCFRKFINAAKFYKAQSLILGGDITGKVMIPIVDQGGGKWVADYLGDRKEFSKEEKVAEFEKTLAEGGIYSIRVSKSGYEELNSNKDKIDSAFQQSMRNSLERWMTLASERLKESGSVCYISVGNDDDYVVDEVLSKETTGNVVFCEEKVIRVDGHEMLSLGTSNRTPWNSPRETDEDVLRKKLDDLAGKMEHPEDSIFSVHVPPIDSGIDSAPKVDENFKPVMKGGHPVMIPAGSSAVREAIERYKPMLGLHGHIHESRGIYKIGRTVCINPGSEYAQGILRGAIVDLEEKKVLDYLLVSG
ncbi:MAG: metallophosphoesterase family protein [Nitrososphaerales archaeon]